MLLPFAASAQRSDSFFSGFEDDDYENRIAYIGLGNQPFGTEPAPVGSGLLVLTVAGAGYAALRRKRSDKSGKSRKTYTTCVLALAMVLAFTGCKKKIEPVVHDNGNSVNITLNVNGGGRHGIVLDQESGYSPVAYREGDVIYVGDGSSYVGSLTCQSDGTTFTGTITPSPTAENLYFYYVGGLTPQNWGGEVGATSFTVDIHDQSNTNAEMDNTNKLPVLSVGTKDYYPGKVEFDCILENKCALVKFRLNTNVGDAKVRISNMLSEAKIDFANHCITPTGTLDAITLYCGPSNNGEQIGTNNSLRWAILLPSAERSGYVIVEENSNSLKFYKEVSIPEINPEVINYIYNPLDLDNATETNDPLFVVSDNYNVVRFSPGNLQYQPSSKSWRFAEHQWDYVGDGTYGNVYAEIGEVNTKCNNALISNSYKGWIDLFGWGTWGNNNNPCNSSIDNDNYSWTGDFSGNIINDDNTGWRSLTHNELTCLNTQHNSKNKIGKGEVFGVRCAIIAPINKTTPDLGDGKWTSVVITDANWGTWRDSGVLILPVTGMRNGTTVTKTQPASSATYMAHYYWLSTPSAQYNWSAWCMTFGSGQTITSYEGLNSDSWGRRMGLAVRLVR